MKNKKIKLALGAIAASSLPISAAVACGVSGKEEESIKTKDSNAKLASAKLEAISGLPDAPQKEDAVHDAKLYAEIKTARAALIERINGATSIEDLKKLSESGATEFDAYTKAIKAYNDSTGLTVARSKAIKGLADLPDKNDAKHDASLFEVITTLRKDLEAKINASTSLADLKEPSKTWKTELDAYAKAIKDYDNSKSPIDGKITLKNEAKIVSFVVSEDDGEENNYKASVKYGTTLTIDDVKSIFESKGIVKVLDKDNYNKDEEGVYTFLITDPGINGGKSLTAELKVTVLPFDYSKYWSEIQSIVSSESNNFISSKTEDELKNLLEGKNINDTLKKEELGISFPDLSENVSIKNIKIKQLYSDESKTFKIEVVLQKSGGVKDSEPKIITIESNEVYNLKTKIIGTNDDNRKERNVEEIYKEELNRVLDVKRYTPLSKKQIPLLTKVKLDDINSYKLEIDRVKVYKGFNRKEWKLDNFTDVVSDPNNFSALDDGKKEINLGNYNDQGEEWIVFEDDLNLANFDIDPLNKLHITLKWIKNSDDNTYSLIPFYSNPHGDTLGENDAILRFKITKASDEYISTNEKMNNIKKTIENFKVDTNNLTEISPVLEEKTFDTEALKILAPNLKFPSNVEGINLTYTHKGIESLEDGNLIVTVVISKTGYMDINAKFKIHFPEIYKQINKDIQKAKVIIDKEFKNAVTTLDQKNSIFASSLKEKTLPKDFGFSDPNSKNIGIPDGINIKYNLKNADDSMGIATITATISKSGGKSIKTEFTLKGFETYSDYNPKTKIVVSNDDDIKNRNSDWKEIYDEDKNSVVSVKSYNPSATLEKQIDLLKWVKKEDRGLYKIKIDRVKVNLGQKSSRWNLDQLKEIVNNENNFNKIDGAEEEINLIPSNSDNEKDIVYAKQDIKLPNTDDHAGSYLKILIKWVKNSNGSYNLSLSYGNIGPWKGENDAILRFRITKSQTQKENSLKLNSNNSDSNTEK